MTTYKEDKDLSVGLVLDLARLAGAELIVELENLLGSEGRL